MVIADNGTQRGAIDGAVDIEALSAGVATNLVILTAFDPAVTGDGVMLRMGGVHEINQIIRRFFCFQCLILFDESPLPVGIGFAGNQFGFFVDIARSMQQLRHAAFTVGNLPRLFDLMRDFFRREIKMLIQRLSLFFIQCGVAATGFVFLQGWQAAFAIALKVIADGLAVNQQGFRNLCNRPACLTGKRF